METQLGTKLNKVVADFDTISKNRAGPVFNFKETDTMFILSANLKGYGRENIKVEIIENWTIITISGEYPIEETLMVGMKVVKKETNMRRFRKSFRIPPLVILNQIMARFDRQESILTISMPKLLKELSGVAIEEVELDEFVIRQPDQIVQIRDKEVTGDEIILPGRGNDQSLAVDATREADQLLVSEETQTKLEGGVNEVNDRDIVEESGELLGREATRETDQLLVRQETERKLEEEEEETRRKEVDELVKDEDSKRGEKPCSRKLCACCYKFAGSALLVSLVLIIFHFVREKNQTNKKKVKN